MGETTKTGNSSEISSGNTVKEAEAKEKQQEVPDSNVENVESNPESSNPLDSNDEKIKESSTKPEVDATISTTDGASSTSGEETETNIVDSSAKNDEKIPSNATVEEQKTTTPQEAM